MRVMICCCEEGVLFCNGGVCGKEFSLNPPFLVEFYSDSCVARAYISGENLGWAVGCNVVFTSGLAVIYIQKQTQYHPSKTEYIASERHLVCCNSGDLSLEKCGGVEVFCGDGGASFPFCNLEKSECVNVDGVDYLFLQFASRLIILRWDGLEYIASEEIPCSSFEISHEKAKLNFASNSSCGMNLFGEISFSIDECEIWSGGAIYQSGRFENGENYIFETFDAFFFELLQLSRLATKDLQARLLKPYLESELFENLQQLFTFFGDFCGLLPDVDGVILIYQKENSIFETRKFQIEKENHNGKLVVSNIAECEVFSPPSYIPSEFSKAVMLL